MGDLTVESYEDGGAMPLRVYAYTLLEWKLCALQPVLNQDLQDSQDL